MPVTCVGEVQARVPDPLDDVVERGEGRGRVTGSRAVALAQHLDERAQLDEGLLARPLDDPQCLVDLLGVGAAQVQRDRRLHVDQGHVVGDDVVQVLRDPQAVLPRPPPALLGQRPAVGERPLAADPGDLGEGEHEQAPGQRGRRRAPRPPQVGVERDGDGVGEEHPARDEPRDQPVPGEDRRDERDHEGDHDRPVRVAQHQVGRGHRADRDGHGRHPGARHRRERHGPGEQQDDGEEVERAPVGLGPRGAQAAQDLHDGEQHGQGDPRRTAGTGRPGTAPRWAEPGIRRPVPWPPAFADRCGRRAGGGAGHASSVGTGGDGRRPAHEAGSRTPAGVGHA